MAEAPAEAPAPPADGDLDPAMVAYYEAAPASTTTGTCVAADTATARSTTWPGAPTSTRPAAGSTSSDSAGGSSSWRPARAGGRRSSPAVASCGATTRPRRPSSSPASAWSPTTCGRISMSATRGPSRNSRADGALHGLLAQPRSAPAPRSVPGPRPALARAWRPDRVHRLAPRSVLFGDRPPAGAGRDHGGAEARRRAHVHDPQGLLCAGGARGRSRRRRLRGDPRSPPRPGSSSWAGDRRRSRRRRPEGRRYTRGHVPPLEANDRDRGLRRHGRGDDRRPAPRRPRQAGPGRRQPSARRASGGARAASTGSGRPPRTPMPSPAPT